MKFKTCNISFSDASINGKAIEKSKGRIKVKFRREMGGAGLRKDWKATGDGSRVLPGLVSF